MAADETSVESLLKRVEQDVRISNESKIKAKNMLLIVVQMEAQAKKVDDEAYGKPEDEQQLKTQKRDFLAGLCQQVKRSIEFGMIPSKDAITDYTSTTMASLAQYYPNLTLEKVLERKVMPFFKSRTADLLQKLIDEAPQKGESMVNSAPQNRK